MRFHYGPFPEDPDFHPEEQGWHSIKEPGPLLVQVLAIPVALVVFLSLVTAITLLSTGNADLLAFSWEAIIVLLAIIPMHELVHVLGQPGFGRSQNSVIGVWPARLAFYAHYEGPIPRGRCLAGMAAPFVVLSLVPLLILALNRWIPIPAGLLSFLAQVSWVNGVAASGDLVGMLLIGFQVPRSAIVRNQGWRSYWRSDLV